VPAITEHWFALTAGPKEVYHILDALDGELGFLADTGNWSGATKYDDLAAIFARAQRCHAKASFAPGQKLDLVDFRHCIEAAKSAGYEGPFALIFADDGEEWAGLDQERAVVREVYGTGV